MTARDSYREPRSSFEAIAELRRVAGTQLDAELVELFIAMLADKTLSYRHGEDADFEAELALDKRIHDYVGADRREQERGRLASGSGHTKKPWQGPHLRRRRTTCRTFAMWLLNRDACP